MEDRVKDMTVRELADLLNGFVEHDMGDEPIRISGNAIRSVGYVQARDGEVAHVNLKDTRPDTSKMKRVTSKNYTCKITRIDPPEEKGSKERQLFSRKQLKKLPFFGLSVSSPMYSHSMVPLTGLSQT